MMNTIDASVLDSLKLSQQPEKERQSWAGGIPEADDHAVK